LNSEEKLQLAVETLFDSLTVSWEDNGNIMAEVVRDSTITNLSKITGNSFDEVRRIVNIKVENSQ
jgi:predicted RNA binding protein with dsRBD fold (UPF0201 family)